MTHPSRPLWLLLDFDNTLMATEQFALPSLIARFNELYGKQIPEMLTIEVFKQHFHGQARDILCTNLSGHYKITVDCKLLYQDREWQMMQHLQKVPGGIPMAPNLIEALTTLQNKGIKFAFVSNNPISRALTAMRFAANGLGETLAHFFGCHYFEAGDVQKPKPDVYQRTMKQLGITTNDCVAVEDSITGSTAAIAAGIRTFGFTGFADNPKTAATQLLAQGCVAVFQDWKDFPTLLDTHSPQKKIRSSL